MKKKKFYLVSPWRICRKKIFGTLSSEKLIASWYKQGPAGLGHTPFTNSNTQVISLSNYYPRENVATRVYWDKSIYIFFNLHRISGCLKTKIILTCLFKNKSFPVPILNNMMNNTRTSAVKELCFLLRHAPLCLVRLVHVRTCATCAAQLPTSLQACAFCPSVFCFLPVCNVQKPSNKCLETRDEWCGCECGKCIQLQ